MALPEIVPLRERDLPAAAAALSRAFDHDPLQMYVFPDPVERAARSPALFTPLLRYGLLFGEVLTTAGGPVGAAVWLGPAAWEVTPGRAKAAGLDELPTVLGAAAAERFLSVLAAIDPYHHRDVPPAHWYVMVVGVAPEAQGTGIGQALYDRRLIARKGLGNRVIWRQRNRQTSRSTKNSDLTELCIHGNRTAACDCGHSAIPRLRR